MSNTTQSLSLLLQHIENSQLKNSKIILCHSKDWLNSIESNRLDIELYNTQHDCTEYEFHTLKKIWDDSANEDFYALYLHCKGSSKNDFEFQKACAWSEYMLDATVTNSEMCIQHLNSGADLVGCMWYWHYKGNFFWCNSQYIRQLPNPLQFLHSGRYFCEYWCSYAYWNNQFKLPAIKNLFYLPLTSDNDFIKLKTAGFKPDHSKKTVFTGDFAQMIERKNYLAYDRIEVNNSDFNLYKNMFAKYINYDGVIVNTDLLMEFDLNSI